MAEGTKDVVTRQTRSSSWSEDDEAPRYGRTQIQPLLMPAITLWDFPGGSDGKEPLNDSLNDYNQLYFLLCISKHLE